MVNNQDLVTCSEKITYLSLLRGAVLTTEKDGKKKKEFSIALNVTRTIYKVATSLAVENFLARTPLLLISSRRNWKLVTIVSSKCFVAIHLT